MYITEGGNVSVTGTDGEVYSAQKIPIKDIGRDKFINDFSKGMRKLNRLFYKKTKKWIWDEETFFKGGVLDAQLFNGSTSYMMDQSVPDEAVLELKPSMGDIDLIVPEELKDDLWQFLKELKGSNEAKISDELVFIGDNKNTLKMVNDQINAVFEYTPDDLKDDRYFVQVDFELLPFEGEETFNPTEFSKFGHSSTLKDLQAGVKAVFHKYLLRSISYGVSLKSDIIQVTSKATTDNWQKKIKKKQGDTLVKFSVSKGVRLAYEPLLAFDGSPITDEKGNLVFREIPTADSTYKKELETIFEMFFNRKPTKSELKEMWSFVGLTELMKKYLSHQQIAIIIDRFYQLLWEVNKAGDKNVGQELERDSAELDFELKNAAVSYLKDHFPQDSKKIAKDWEKTIEQYYKLYANGESMIVQALAKARLKK